MFSWIRRIQTILDKEPETWIAYLHGQHPENISRLKESKPRLTGKVQRITVFFIRLLQQMRLTAKPRIERFTIYGGTANQRDALTGTITALHEHQCRILALTNPATFDEGAQAQGFSPLRFSPADILKTALLLLLRHNTLKGHLHDKYQNYSYYRLDAFFWSYSYLVYFERLFRSSRPEYIIVSNDHNVPNRALIATADAFKIKTVYMQHASVSKLFPALNFKYAFLDGQAAADIYQQCETHHPPKKPPRRDRYIFLSGQKKKLVPNGGTHNYSVGVALNALDDPADIGAFLGALHERGISAKVRWHPRLKGQALKPFLDIVQGHKSAVPSDPSKESVSQFLRSIKMLVAGNSSIHLEAALAGIAPIYYEFCPVDNPDYYGYVSKGVSHQALSIEQLMDLLDTFSEQNQELDIEKIRYFSSTIGTEWDGKEGALVAHHLLSLSEEVFPGQLFGYIEFSDKHKLI